MGYKVTFESGHVVNFENEPTYADINEAEKQLGISKGTSLVDRIPGLAPEVKQPPEDTSPIGVISNVGNALGSGLETVASIGSGLTSGMAGSLLGGWNALVSGRDFVKGMHEGGEALTYHPRLDQAQSDTANINEELNRVLAPMMGHMSGFSVPLKPIKGIKPKVEIPPEVSPDVKKTLLATAVKNVENKLNLVKQKEQELMGFENLSPDLQKEQEFLYQQRLKLEADLEHLNSIMGVTKEKPSFTNREDIINAISDTEKQIQALKKKSQITQLTENEINLYDTLQIKLSSHKKELGSIMEQEQTKPKFDDSIKETPPVEVALVKINQVGKDKKKALKYKEKAIEKLSTLVEEQNINNIPGKDYNALRRSLEEEIKAYDEIIAGREPNLDWFNDKDIKPLEPTARPLEGVKTTEPIPTPELTTLRPLEAPTKPLNEHPPGNVNWDRSQEWRSTDTPNADTWRIIDEVHSAEFDRIVNENLKAEREAKALRDFQAQEPPANRNNFSTKEELHAWLDQQRDGIIKKIQRVQNLLEWAKENQVSEVQLKNRKVTTEDLLAARDNLNRDLDKLNQRKTKSLFSGEELNPDLPPKVYNPDGAKYSKESILSRLNGVIGKYESMLKRIRDSIHAYEQGVMPSGGTVFTQKGIEYGLDAAKALEEKLTETYTRYVNNKEKLLNSSRPLDEIKGREKSNTPKQELPTIDPLLLDGDTATPIVKYDTVDDILIAEKNPIDAFINNPELFDTVTGKDTHVDKELVRQAPGIVKTVEAFVKDLGLDLDKLYIVDSDTSKVVFQGNSAVIHIDLKTHLTNRDVYMNNPKTRPIVEKLSPENYAHFVVAKVVGHEFGHYVFTKWLKFDNVTNERFTTLIQGFNEWSKKNKIEPITWINSLERAEYQKYHSLFDEYFAERTADSLLRNTLLDRFSDKRFKIAKQIRSVVDTMTSWLEKQGIKINKFDAVEDLIQDIRNRNAQAIKESGKTLWNKLETEQNDKLILDNKDNTYPFAKRTLEEIREKPFEVFDKDDNPIQWQRKIGEAYDMPDIVNFSSKALDFIGNSGPWLSRKLFGKTTVAGIFKNNPRLQRTHYMIRNAEERASKVTNNLWYLDIPYQAWKDAPILQRFSKVKLPDSPAMVWKSLTNLESFRLHEVYKQGWDAQLSHADSLAQFGQHLTQKEKNSYKVFGEMMDRAFDHIQALEMELGKKDIIQKAPGYYPAVRRGSYFVNVRYGDVVAHRQHFNTKVAAEAWVKKVEPQLGNHFQMGVIENIKDGPQHPGVFEMIDVFDNYAANKHKLYISDIAAELKEKLATRGGKMGHHHDQRFNISGYKGSEFGFTPEELGHSFKQGIQDFVQEFQSQYKSMIIRHKIDPILEAHGFREDYPQTHAAIEQIKDSALNVLDNKVEAFDRAIYESTDKVARGIYESLYPNKLFNPKDPVYKTFQAGAISTFYLFKVLSSLAMAIVQLFNPVVALRHGAIDNGFLTIGSFGKGMFKLFTGDAELLRSLHEVTQTTDIIEPQFLNTLHMKGENKLLEGLKDWVAMRKPQEACDIVSRTMGYAYFYTHYKDIGHTPLEAKTLAMEAIDANFGAYTRGETAPVFQHLGGIIGEGMRPLQTFGQMTVGNLVADVKRIFDDPKKLKSYAPFIMYGLTATLLGGAVTGPIMNQYETMRQFFMKMKPEWDIPSALDLTLKGVLSLDNVVEDKDALTKLIAYGVLSQQTGIDIGASARTTETLPGTMLSVLLSMVEGDKAATEIAREAGRLMPVHSNIIHMASGATTLTKSLVKDVPKNELKQGITDVAMRGPMKNALMEATGANKTTVMGKDTNMIASGSDSSALMEEGPKEKIAHWMGNMSTEERFRTDQKIEDQFKTKAFNDKIKRMFVLYNQTLKPEYLDKLIELGATDANIKNQLKTRAYKALVPADIREVTNNKGKVPNNLSSVRKIEHQGLFNFRRQ